MADTPATPSSTASIGDTATTVATVLLPLVAKGLILRRPPVVSAAARIDADRRAVRHVRRLRHRYGTAPLALRIPGKDVVLVLGSDDVGELLERSPHPFAPGAREKRAALDHLQPGGVLASRTEDRAPRRHANEHALDFPVPIHHLAPRFTAVIAEEVTELLRTASPRLTWDAFITAWFQIVRRITFGDAARDDDTLTELSGQLRAAGNWAFLRPNPDDVRARFLSRIQGHIDQPEERTLISVLARLPDTPETALAHQVPQWLFAFDPAGMATYRTLAILATHPTHLQRALEEVDGSQGDGPQLLPHLRSCVLESVRLWPTTPAILREAVEDTTLGGHHIRSGATIVVHTPSFHRDPDGLESADRVDPDLWDAEDGAPTVGWALVPFSAGPGRCPGQHLVLLTASTFLAHLLRTHVPGPDGEMPLDPDAPLPGTFDHHSTSLVLQGR